MTDGYVMQQGFNFPDRPDINSDVPLSPKVTLGHAMDLAAGMFKLHPDKFADTMLSDRMEFRMWRDGKFDFQALTMPGVTVRSRNLTSPNWSSKGVPRKGSIKLMVVLPCPTYVEYQSGTIAHHNLDPLLRRIWDTTEITPYDTYVTYAIKFVPPKSVIKQTYVTESRPVLQYEVSQIEPDVILAMGGNALKCLGNSKTKVDNVYGTDVARYGDWHAKLFYSDPPNFDAAPKTRLAVEAAVDRMAESLNGTFTTTEDYIDNVPEHKDYRFIRSAQGVKDAVELVLERNPTGPIYLALDCEWGRHVGDIDNFLHNKTMVIQFSDRAHEAFVVYLRDADLVEIHTEEAYKVIIAWIKHLLEDERVKLAGQNLKSDILQLTSEGIDCRERYHFDTMTAFHLLKPHTARHGLEEIALIYTDLGRYDRGLNLWVEKHSSKKEIEARGYAMVPAEVMAPYAAKDVDAIMQAWPLIVRDLQDKELEAPYEMDGVQITNQYLAYQYVMHKCDVSLVDLEYNGVPADLETMMALEPMYREKADELLDVIKARLNWKSFNPASPLDMPWLLFGLKSKPKGCTEKVDSLYLTPIKTTGKYPRLWAEMSDEERKEENPATDAETLMLLKEEAKEANKPNLASLLDTLWKFRLVHQINTQMLHAPTSYDTTGRPLYTTGYIGLTDNVDNCIHGTFLQLTQTGRLNSRNPNLNNQSGSAERFCLPMFTTPAGKAAIECEELDLGSTKWQIMIKDGHLDPRYKPVRSILRAKPGWVFVGADYSQAELFTLACVSGDIAMQDIMFDPLADVHSMICVSAFKVDVPGGVEDLKKWVEGNGYKDLRNAAKSVIFGIIYGRGPTSILRQIQSYGITMTLDEVIKIIEGVYEMFPMVETYIAKQHKAVYTKGYAENPFGRRRYFFKSNWKGLMKAQERESVNFPIQSTVGDVLPMAMHNFMRWKGSNPAYRFQQVLPYHDAVYLHVPCEEVEEVVSRVIPWCMTDNAEIPNIGLRLKTDADIMYHFGTKGNADTIIAQSMAAAKDPRFDPLDITHPLDKRAVIDKKKKAGKLPPPPDLFTDAELRGLGV